MALLQLQDSDTFYVWKTKLNQGLTYLGDMVNLNLSAIDKTSIVVALNKIISIIGTLTALKTTEKTNLVGSINELTGKLLGIPNITIGSKIGNVIRVTVQLKSYDDTTNATNKHFIKFYLSDSAASGTTTVEPDGGVSIGTQGAMISLNSNKIGDVLTNSTGLFNIDITHSGTKTYYLNVIIPNGLVYSSTVITF